MHNFPVNCGGHLQAKSTVPMGIQVAPFWQGLGMHLFRGGILCGGERPTGCVGGRPGCKPVGVVGRGGLSPTGGLSVGWTAGR